MKAHGHRRINIGDFGDWACHGCYQSGSSWTKPEDYECKFHNRYYVIAIDPNQVQAEILREGSLRECVEFLYEDPQTEVANHAIQGHQINLEPKMQLAG